METFKPAFKEYNYFITEDMQDDTNEMMASMGFSPLQLDRELSSSSDDSDTSLSSWGTGDFVFKSEKPDQEVFIDLGDLNSANALDFATYEFDTTELVPKITPGNTPKAASSSLSDRNSKSKWQTESTNMNSASSRDDSDGHFNFMSSSNSEICHPINASNGRQIQTQVAPHEGNVATFRTIHPLLSWKGHDKKEPVRPKATNKSKNCVSKFIAIPGIFEESTNPSLLKASSFKKSPLAPLPNSLEQELPGFGPVKKRRKSGKQCVSCQVTETPFWRNVDGLHFCNACGIRYKKRKDLCASCHYVPRVNENCEKGCPACGKAFII